MKKIFKLCIYIFAILIFSLGTDKILAAESIDKIYHGEYVEPTYYYMHQKPGSRFWEKMQIIRRKSDNAWVYCIQPFTSINTKSDYDVTIENIHILLGVSQETWNELYKIAYYGYEYKDATHDHSAPKWYAAAQMLIWQKVNPNVASHFTKTLRGDIDDTILKNEMDEIMDLVSKHLTKPSFENIPTKMSYGETITITDSKGVLSNYELINVKGANITKEGNNLTITSTTVGTISFQLYKPCNRYGEPVRLYYSTTSQNAVRRGDVDPINVNLSIISESGKVELHKIDSETNSPQGSGTLENAVYGIYELNGNLVQELTTDKNGYAISDYLPYVGDFYIKEIKASNGYEIDNEKHYFSINLENLLAKVTSKEKAIKNYISILKQYDYVDGNTTFLNAEEGIKFEIYDSNNKLINTITTDKNGYATINLAYGVYKFHQVNSNTGYEKINDFYITVDDKSEKTQYYNILNNALSAYLQVFKIDSETNKRIALSNTKFKIYNKDTEQYVSQYVAGKVLSEFKTDENGVMFTYLKLSAGNYRLIEIESPKGYLLSNTPIDFSISDNTKYNYTSYGPVVTISFKNKPIKGKIELNKIGQTFIIDDGFYYDEKYLKDIKFEIYAEEDILSSDKKNIYYSKDQLVETITTDKNGYASSSLLPLGKYYLIEKNIPIEYVDSKSKYEVELVEIDNNTEVVYEYLEIENYLKKGNLEFTKTDFVTGDSIPNTKIEIYTDKDKLVYYGVTDEDGKIIIENLKVGKYYIIETEAATGYKISEEKVMFEIKEDGQVVKAKMTNKKITGSLEFSKVDFSTSEPLPNTKIEIYDENDKLIFAGITNGEGKININELDYGKYYILEKEAPEGYILNPEKMYFEIKEDGEIVRCTMNNKKIIVKVPITESNSNILEISIFLMLMATVVIIYEKIKNGK